MNKFILLFAALALFSCSSGDDSNATNNSIDNSLLIGKWEIVSMTRNGQTLELNSCSTGTYKEYKTDNAFIEHYVCGTENYLDTSTYSVSNNTITYVLDEPGPDEPIFRETVDELTQNSLKTSFQYNEDGTVYTNRTVFRKIN